MVTKLTLAYILGEYQCFKIMIYKTESFSFKEWQDNYLLHSISRNGYISLLTKKKSSYERVVMKKEKYRKIR